jgi:hypothetical protein
VAFEVIRSENGTWLCAVGRTFPAPPQVSIPHNARFFRDDTAQEYTWDSAAQSWILVMGGGPGASVTVQESDGTPAVASVDNLQFDQADGFVVTDLGGGDARVDLDAIPQAKVANLTTDLAGKSAVGHSHAESDVTGLVSDLAAKVPTTRTISTTAPLTGGGDLSANRTLAVSNATTAAVGVVELATDGESAANVVVQGNDARLSNARTPTAHKTSHQDGGADELSVAGLSGLLADGQTPLAHAASHRTGGSDSIKLDDLAAPDDNTDLNASTSAHGLLRKLDGNTANFLRGDGAWAAPPAGSGGGNFVEVALALDGQLIYTTTVTGQAWVTSTSKIVCSLFAVANGGTTEEMVMASGVNVGVKARVDGVGFDVWAYNPHGFSGTITVHCVGA